MAETASQISYDIKFKDGYLTIKSWAIFYKNQSWMTDKTPQMLNHEQGHFDIAEIYSRKFENEINSQKLKDMGAFMSFIHNTVAKIDVEENTEHDRFDKYSLTTVGREWYEKWIKEQLSTVQRSK